MAKELPGPHHCIGTARIAAEIIFRGLRARAVAGGGSLTLEELESFHSKFVESFSAGFHLFELRHEQCMDASMGLAKMPFARQRILATLLRACGEQSVRAAFSNQVEDLGSEWIDVLFDGVAEYTRKRARADLEERLTNAYAYTATIRKTKLTIDDLLEQEAVRLALFECADVIDKLGETKMTAGEVVACVNDLAVRQRGWPDVCKITEDQALRFLALLSREVRAAIARSGPPQHPKHACAMSDA